MQQIGYLEEICMNENQIRNYSRFVYFLGQALGPDYEVVLSDLKSILAICHGEISKRTVGSPLTELTRQIIQSKSYLNEDSMLNYQGTTASGKILRCSTFYIKSPSGVLEGLFCINFDDARYKELVDRTFRLCHPDQYVMRNVEISQKQSDTSETFYADIDEVIEDACNRVLNGRDVDKSRLHYREKMSIIRELNKVGIFTIKGAIPAVSKKIHSSVASIYRYLSLVKERPSEE